MLAGNAAQAGLPETGVGLSRFHRACPDASFQIIACNGLSQQTTTSAGIGNARSGPYTIPFGLDCIVGICTGSSLEMYPQLHMLLTSFCSSFATASGSVEHSLFGSAPECARRWQVGVDFVDPDGRLIDECGRNGRRIEIQGRDNCRSDFLIRH
jgi:hypothetical protein